MDRMSTLRMLLLSLSPVALMGDATIAQHLHDRSFAVWREYILPKPKELVYAQIDWKLSFWEGVVAAQQQDKPILLYAMTGHPCGAV
jgi:hypothetical protein